MPGEQGTHIYNINLLFCLDLCVARRVIYAVPMPDPKTQRMAQTGTINVPYLNAYGNVAKVLDRIKTASTPDRFTQDFLATKLGLKGGSAKPLIPFLKRTGFLNSDGTPTELYKQFRNDSLRPAAAAQAVKTAGTCALYELNEHVHELSDMNWQGVILCRLLA